MDEEKLNLRRKALRSSAGKAKKKDVGSRALRVIIEEKAGAAGA